jgi:type II secretory pathway pseudopilin PulG
VLVVVAIILVLASVATVAVLQIQKENKADIAKIQATSLATALKTYMIKNDNNPPASINDILRYVDGNDPSKLNDPWGQPFQIGSSDNGTGTTTYYIFTTHPETGEQIRSDSKN